MSGERLSAGEVPLAGERSAPPGRYHSLSASEGYDHVCALLQTGGFDCWGSDYTGLEYDRLGYFTSRAYESISVGGGGYCAVRESGEIDCWSHDTYPKRGTPSGKYRAVSVGQAHTCAVQESGDLACWGAGFDTDDLLNPPSGTYESVSSSSSHSCALHETGRIDCWGEHRGIRRLRSDARASGAL